MAVMEISVVPLGTSSPSVSDYVADCVKVLEEEGLRYEVTPMGTQVEGDLEDLLRAVRKMHEVPFQKGALRVVTTVKIDDRRDKPLTLEGKRQAVLEKLTARD
ncbi:MAG TPA: MTH1187 family thiamine-binding protein [Deltaproteobacteria bacterium]|nr:MTH1187 family thiamine-binding protein [Deltaproteobacteria bacterium]